MERRTVRWLARGSWILALMAIAINMADLKSDLKLRYWLLVASAAVSLIGFLIGIIALTRALRSGRERSFRHAMVGVMANAAMLLFLGVVLAMTPMPGGEAPQRLGSPFQVGP